MKRAKLQHSGAELEIRRSPWYCCKRQALWQKTARAGINKQHNSISLTAPPSPALQQQFKSFTEKMTQLWTRKLLTVLNWINFTAVVPFRILMQPLKLIQIKWTWVPDLPFPLPSHRQWKKERWVDLFWLKLNIVIKAKYLLAFIIPRTKIP